MYPNFCIFPIDYIFKKFKTALIKIICDKVNNIEMKNLSAKKILIYKIPLIFIISYNT